jgi:glycerol-3-phosphate dehydrogenase
MSGGDDKKERREFDIIVVGSGAGLTGIAVPSSRNGLRVCLVEVS